MLALVAGYWQLPRSIYVRQFKVQPRILHPIQIAFRKQRMRRQLHIVNYDDDI